MYTLNKCRFPGCNKCAISVSDSNVKLTGQEGFCIDHCPDKIQAINTLKEYIYTHDKIVGMTACGLVVEDLNLNGKKFYGCNFQHCTFTNIHAQGFRARMCMFDFSTFTDCYYIESNVQFSSFSGSKFVHMILTGSDLIHNNFNGITSYQSSFDDCDLYNSRFIKALLINTSLKNCNLKKTAFYESARENVSFKLSNTREALVDRNKGGLMGDFNARLEEEDEQGDNL